MKTSNYHLDGIVEALLIAQKVEIFLMVLFSLANIRTMALELFV